MEFTKLGEEIVARAKKYGADEAEACLERIKTFNVQIRNGQIDILQKSVSKGLGITVFSDKRLGFTSTSDLSAQSLDEAVKKTVELSRVTEPKDWNGLPDPDDGTPRDLDLFDPEIARIPDKNKIAMAQEAEKAVRELEARMKNTNGSFTTTERETCLVNSKGLSRFSRDGIFSIGAGGMIDDGNAIQAGGWSSTKRFFKDLLPVGEIARTAVRLAVEKLGPRTVPTKKVPVIFDRLAAFSFWAGILSSLNGGSAFRGTTFLAGFLDKEIASPLITLVDDPTIPRHPSSAAFDGEGKITRRNTIIEKGFLKTFLYDTISARKAGVRVNTMTRRGGYWGAPYATFLNAVVEKGTSSPADLVKGMKEGLQVTGMRDYGTNAVNGNFSTGCNGFWIQDGVRAFPVDGLTLGGSTIEILKGIDAVGDDLELLGNLNSPSFRTAELTVGGK